tara:strand:- start:981 stop:1199 length:219 start_codon:yes stop_codon:yes gene_type:complete
MARKNNTQEIWTRNKDFTLELKLPKVINTDIGFQLMFGLPEDSKEERRIIRRHITKYTTTVYLEEELKIWFF